MSATALQDAFNRAMAAIDDAQRLVREMGLHAPTYLVDTLSTSLAEPQEAQIEIALSKARFDIQNDGDRATLIRLARGFQKDGLITEDARDRLIQDFDRHETT